MATIVIRNLDHGVTEEDLLSLVESDQAGAARKVSVMFDDVSSDRKGYFSTRTASIKFPSEAQATAFYHKYNDVTLDGRPMKMVQSPPTSHKPKHTATSSRLHAAHIRRTSYLKHRIAQVQKQLAGLMADLQWMEDHHAKDMAECDGRE